MKRINVDIVNDEKETVEKNMVLDDSLFEDGESAVLESQLEESQTEEELWSKEESQTKEDSKIKKINIILDENLMPKKETSDVADRKKSKQKLKKKSKKRRKRKKQKKQKRQKRTSERVSFVEALKEKMDAVSYWFAEQYEQLKDLRKEPTNDLDGYRHKVRVDKMMRVLKTVGLVVGIVSAIVLGKYIIDHHTYDKYSVINQTKRIDTGASHFVEFDGKILHYSADGAALVTASEKQIWVDSYQMSQPMVDVSRSSAAIYDLKGTQIAVYNDKGKLGAFQTEYPIIKASISAKGSVAVILEKGETTLINYYSETGSMIASSSTNMKNPGYPVDLSVSKDGLSVTVSYFVADEDTISSYIAFYNFGEDGRKKDNNLIDGVRCAGILVPEIQYLDNNRVVAYTENGFKLYKVKAKAEEIKEVTFEQDIVSSFCDGEHIGFIFRGDTAKQSYVMKVYDISGNLKMETNVDFSYDDVKISGNKIVFNNATQMAVYSMKGIQKYVGTIEEGMIHEVVKIGSNKYTIAYNDGVMTIKLK